MCVCVCMCVCLETFFWPDSVPFVLEITFDRWMFVCPTVILPQGQNSLVREAESLMFPVDFEFNFHTYRLAPHVFYALFSQDSHQRNTACDNTICGHEYK